MSEPATSKPTPTKPVSSAAPKPGAATNPKTNTKTVLIVVAVVVTVLVIIPAILFSVGVGVLGHRLSKEVKVSSNGGTTTIQTKNGDQITTGTSKTLPKDFPSVVTVYKGTIVSSARVNFEGKVTYSVAIETKDDPSKISQTLAKDFSANGWSTKLETSTNDGGLITAENGDLHAQILYATKEGKTTISYTVVPVTKD